MDQIHLFSSDPSFSDHDNIDSGEISYDVHPIEGAGLPNFGVEEHVNMTPDWDDTFSLTGVVEGPHSPLADHASTTLHEPLFGDYYGYPNKAAYDQDWKDWNEEQKVWNES